MAIVASNLYSGRVVTGDAGYPLGKAQDIVNGEKGTGTPLRASWVNDQWGFLQALLDAASVTPSGTPDQVGQSDYLDAVNKLIREPIALKIFQSPTESGLTEIQTRTVDSGEVYEVRKASNDSLATIYSDAAGTNEIVQNGTDNKSDSDGVINFYIPIGNYIISSGGEEQGIKVNSSNNSINPDDFGLVGDGLADDKSIMESVLAKAKAEVRPVEFSGQTIYVSGTEIDFSGVSVVGSVYIKGARVKWFRSKFITQTGGLFLCDDCYMSGVWYSKFDYIRSIAGLLIDGGGADWGTFWNSIGTLVGQIKIDASNHSVNQLKISNQRGGIHLYGGYEGNPLPQEIDNVVWEMVDTTGANYTAQDGRSGYHVLDERYENDRTNKIKQLYAEVSGTAAVRGNFHIDGMTNIGGTSNLELPQWNHVLNTSQWTNRGSGDFLAASPKSNLAVGGLWDVLDGEGKPKSFSQANVGATVQIDITEPSGIGFSYGGTTSITFSNLRVKLSNSKEGKYNVFAWIYAPNGLNSIVYDNGGSNITVAGNEHYWDNGDGWRLYRISGVCRSDGLDDQMTIFVHGSTVSEPREVRLGGVWASPHKVSFLPCAVPSEDIKAVVSEMPSTGSIISLPVNGIAYNANESSLAGEAMGWKKNADGSFSEISTTLPFAKTIATSITVPPNSPTTLTSITESGFNVGASGFIEIYWTNSAGSPDFRGGTGYQKAVFSLLADGDGGTHSDDISTVESTWIAKGGSTDPVISITQSGSTWSLQATTGSSIGDSVAYVKVTLYDPVDSFSF